MFSSFVLSMKWSFYVKGSNSSGRLIQYLFTNHWINLNVLERRKQTPRAFNIFFYDLFSKNKKKKKEKKRKKTKVNVIKRQTDNFRKEKKRIHANQMLFRNEELNCRIF